LYWILYVPFLVTLPFAVLFLALFAYASAHPKTLEEDLVWLFSSPWLFAILIVWALVIPVDKVFDGRFRKLEPLKEKSGAV
jgi:hypothetical protein